jgi:hypothetical protein
LEFSNEHNSDYAADKQEGEDANYDAYGYTYWPRCLLFQLLIDNWRFNFLFIRQI